MNPYRPRYQSEGATITRRVVVAPAETPLTGAPALRQSAYQRSYERPAIVGARAARHEPPRVIPPDIALQAQAAAQAAREAARIERLVSAREEALPAELLRGRRR